MFDPSDPDQADENDDNAPPGGEPFAADETASAFDAAPPADHEPIDPDDDWEGVSLEELGAAYAKVMADSGAQDESSDAPEVAAGSEERNRAPAIERALTENDDEAPDDGVVTPEAIIEAALFVGHPENQPLKAKQLAAMIRGVSPKEVEQTIQSLNRSYRQLGQALQIVFEEGGYKLTLAPEVDTVRRAFYGKIREARLSHGALEVLSLVAYQPGITAQKVQDQRGKECGTLLNQLVRRRLLEVRRERPESGGRPVLTYFPTERFLNLFELGSLDDLPQVDEADVSPTL